MKKSLTIFKSFLLAVIMLLSVNSFANEATSNIKLSNGIFKNLSTSPIEGGAVFSWMIDYDSIAYVKNVIIKYCRCIL